MFHRVREAGFGPEESHQHLFIDCPIALEVWLDILGCIGLPSFFLS